jgi:hypothetical protein
MTRRPSGKSNGTRDGVFEVLSRQENRMVPVASDRRPRLLAGTRFVQLSIGPTAGKMPKIRTNPMTIAASTTERPCRICLTRIN